MEDDNWGTPISRCPRDLLSDDRRMEYLNYGLPLFKAAMQGDWEAAKQIYFKHQNCFAAQITKGGDTALHIAALARRTEFVVQLVTLLVKDNCTDLLGLINNMGNSVLCLAAVSGCVKAARAIVNADERLLKDRGNRHGLTPLRMAALFGNRDMVFYLLPLTQPHLTSEERCAVFITAINSDLYDVALDMLRQHSDLVMARDAKTRETPLHVLAKKSLNTPRCCSLRKHQRWNDEDDTPTNKKENMKFHLLRRLKDAVKICGLQHSEVGQQHKALELVEKLWKSVLLKRSNEIDSILKEPWELIFRAVEVGNVEFVTILLGSYPELIWEFNANGLSIFHVAVKHRQEKIFSLIYEIGAIKDLLVTYVERGTENNLLHLAAMLPISDRLNCVSGAALQMQQEKLWFKVVKDVMNPDSIEGKNTNGETPGSLFAKEHKKLRKEGEEWMRNTASSCSFVAALIAASVFAFILKRPLKDGDVSWTNPPNYNWWHWVVAVFDSCSLLTSTTSILVFLSILISRYAEQDFLTSLPRKLVAGLALLFLSIVFITLSTTFHFMFSEGIPWFGIIILWAFTAITYFTTQIFSLMRELFRFTRLCSSSSLRNPTPTLFPVSSQPSIS